jgi:hypothetical protein
MKLQEILGRRSAQAPFSRRRSRRPRLEPLEKRRLLADYTAATPAELIAAINAANATAEADTITLAAGTTFTLTAAFDRPSDGNFTGLPRITPGEDLTIIGNGATIERGTPTDTGFRLIRVESGASLVVEHLTLQGGSSGHGGGAVLNAGSLALEDVVVQHNIDQGYVGFPIFGGHDQPGGDAWGGGVYSTGSLILQSCTIRNNVARGGRGGDGFDGGNAYGGGLFVGGGTLSVVNSNIADNTAQGGQGGTGSRAGDGGNGYGGGLYLAGGSAEIRQTIVTGNHAVGGLGGTGNHKRLEGKPGTSAGGGIYIAALASVGLDAFTIEHVTNNTAKKKPNILGGYTVIA